MRQRINGGRTWLLVIPPDKAVRVIDGVAIPFASPRLLWRMKSKTHREKDAADVLFLREHYGKEIFGEGG